MSDQLQPINIDGEELWVHPENADSLRSFLRDVKVNKPVFLISQVLVVAAILLFQETQAILKLLQLEALILFVLPFSTPQTIQWMGVQNSIRLVRLLAVALFIFASVWKG